MNLPISDLESLERICFQIEEAQWYYEDFIRPLNPDLPSMTLRKFCERMFEHCPTLSIFGEGAGENAYNNFMQYKSRIPVRGAILLNHEMDSVVLVKGWKKSANWSFPRGKINLQEEDLTCAIREVYEETGLDLETEGLVPGDRNVKAIDVTMAEQQMRLFVFRDIPMDTYFEPRTRKEISRVAWWRLSDLPAFKKRKGGQEQTQNAIRPNQFYMVAPFLAPLRKWVIEQKKLDSQRAPVQTQYEAAVSHDELPTEDDVGNESHGQFDTYGSDTDGQPLEATAAFNRLLNIERPGADYMAAAPTPPPPPPPAHATKSTGMALLALLHGAPAAQNAPSLTPLDHIIEQPSMPRSPHYHHPRPPPMSNIPLPPPPPFPIQQQHEFSYQQQQIHAAQHQNNMQQINAAQYQNNMQQRQAHRQEKAQRMQNPHPYQPQHLIHPQPLPPHVQRAVFTGGPVHAPMVPPPIQTQPPPQFQAPVSVVVPNPQFPGVHAPMVPQVQKQTPPKLTSHSLALLNAFKSRDQAQAVTESTQPVDLPLRRFEPPPPPPQRARPQELAGDVSQPPPTASYSQEGGGAHHSPSAPYVQQRAQPNANGSGFVNPEIFTPRAPISETQKSALLGLFKSPTTAHAIPTPQASATALPTSTTPSAVELSAVEPLSSTAASTSALLNAPRKPSQEVKDALIPEMNPELSLPYRATKILARPPQANVQGREPQTVQQKQIPRAIQKRITPVTSSPVLTASPPRKPFQPQILRRPQSGSPQVADASSSPQSHYTTYARPEQKASPVAQMQALLERQINPPPEHKQQLLSLFGKPAGKVVTSQSMAKNLSADRFAAIHDPMVGPSRSRVDSLASTDASRRGSGTPISPADKGFLLSYLENVVKSA